MAFMHPTGSSSITKARPRGETFVTRKITRAVAAIEHRCRTGFPRQYRCKARLGARARFCRGYVAYASAAARRRLCLGDRRNPIQFASSSERAFACIGREIEWRGTGYKETGFDRRSGKDLVRIDPHYFRPTEVDELLATLQGPCAAWLVPQDVFFQILSPRWSTVISPQSDKRPDVRIDPPDELCPSNPHALGEPWLSFAVTSSLANACGLPDIVECWARRWYDA